MRIEKTKVGRNRSAKGKKNDLLQTLRGELVLENSFITFHYWRLISRFVFLFLPLLRHRSEKYSFRTIFFHRSVTDNYKIFENHWIVCIICLSSRIEQIYTTSRFSESETHEKIIRYTWNPKVV